MPPSRRAGAAAAAAAAAAGAGAGASASAAPAVPPAAKRARTAAAAKTSKAKPAAPLKKAAAAPALAPLPPAGAPARFLLEPSWRRELADELSAPYFKAIEEFVARERAAGPVYPPEEEVFEALNRTPFDSVRAVIIGQDPYFHAGQAHGLCFSVRRGVKVPPSLQRMYKELARTIPGFGVPKHGCLSDWADHGVLMLNATLTVCDGKPNSHAKCGWQRFTDAIVRAIDAKKRGVVFLLWGGFAQKKAKVLGPHLLKVETAHPSPLSGAKWINCGCFETANNLLADNGLEPVDWAIAP